MSILLLLLLGLLSFVYGNTMSPDAQRRNAGNEPMGDAKAGPNVITVPTNCPDGKQLINGVCRDVWRWDTPRQRRNAVTAAMRRDVEASLGRESEILN